MTDKHTDSSFIPDISVASMYENWFLEYASYVILDRAVPAFNDGLKPVQRRILHALKEMDDGRFNKVANVIGQTMQYHPHGDASIYEALVNIGQKDLLIEMQGNWGDVRTGDSAAAARYIEARLSKFALEVAFNPNITEWQISYDGRKKEPVNLPIKFPLLLAHGVEGIAVGLATKILPHNFIELIQASIALLKKQKIEIYPDFATGGYIDISQYNEGQKGGRVRVRAKIEVLEKKHLVIREIPFGVTTSSLIESILKANDKGKIKIKKVVDNTAQHVEIFVELPAGVSPDITVDALYAFTDCETPISPNCCVIINNKPHFIGVQDLLEQSTQHTLILLQKELEYNLAQLLETLHFASLEQIFIEKRIYRKIEDCETFEAVVETIDAGLKPYTKLFVREVTRDDILKLMEIRIKRISKYDSFKANEAILALKKEIEQTQYNLLHLAPYAIQYFEGLLKKYGKGRERRTEIKNFDTIKATQVAIANQKLYVNRKDGFIGYGLKKDELICECSDLDEIIIFKEDGKFQVVKIAEKVFVGKDIIFVDVWTKNNDRKIYHTVYVDGKTGKNYVKRFAVTAITREREYDLTQGNPNSRILYFSAHENGESEIINVLLSPACKAKNKQFEYNFADLAVKGREAMGNILTEYPVKKITQKQVGASTIGARKIWFDNTTNRLHTIEYGTYLGEFDTDSQILAIYKDGYYELTNFDINIKYNSENLLLLEKFDPQKTISTLYFNGEKKAYFVKRFKIETTTTNQPFNFVFEHKDSKALFATTQPQTYLLYEHTIGKTTQKTEKPLDFETFIDVKGWKALGNKLTEQKIVSLKTAPRPQNIGTQNALEIPNTPQTITPNLPLQNLEDKATTSLLF